MKLTRDEQHLLNKAELRGAMNAVFALARSRVLMTYKARMNSLDLVGDSIPMLAMDLASRQEIMRDALLDALDVPTIEGAEDVS